MLLKSLVSYWAFLSAQQPIATDHISLNRNVSVIDVENLPTDLLTSTAWAIIYTYPLAFFANFAGTVFKHVDVNEIFHQRNLASPDDGGVFTPNVDTLYSRVVLDLSEHDIILTVPEIDKSRYWNYPVYDAFSNHLASIGAVNGNRPGKYLIRRADDAGVESGYEDCTLVDNPSLYRGIVSLPGSHGTMLIRLQVIENFTSELELLHKYQNASSLTPIRRIQSRSRRHLPSPIPKLTRNSSLLGVRSPEQQLDLAARIVPYNPPLMRSDRQRVSKILFNAGLYNGKYQRRSTVNLHVTSEIANASILADVNRPDHVRYQGNGYYLQIPSYQGNYGSHYASAAYVALSAPQQQVVQQTLYPGYQSVGFNTLYQIPENRSWLFTFSGKPRLRKFGFWSLSIYGADGNLVRNDLNRFSVSDRSLNLTYPDGEQVYGPEASELRDGPFEVLVQPVWDPPPANWTGNWLPSEDAFYMLLRWYVPDEAMTNGSYEYPVVKTIPRIRS